jgi:quinol monooxygenase YgiN
MAWTLKSLEWVQEVSRTANPNLEGVLMLIYQLKIEIKPYKPDEFVDSLRSLMTRIRREKGCLDFRVCQDSEEENTYLLLAEWKTRKAMEKHFKTHEFELLIGTAKVLGKTFKMSIAEVSKTGGFELARKQIVSQQQKSGVGQ